MNYYQSLDFSDARDRAFKHISRLFTIHKIENLESLLPGGEAWEVELELDRPEEVICLKVKVIITPDFPLEFPFIFIGKDELERLGFSPNINTKGEICTFDRNTSVPNPEAPENLIEECIRRAKSIVEQGYKNNHLDSYTNEFIAYWEGKYGEETEIDTCVLSLVDECGELPDQITYVQFEKTIGKFHSLLYADPKSFKPVEAFLEHNQIGYDEISTFYIGQLKGLAPPFHMHNDDVKKLINSLDQITEFREYLNSNPILPIVTFSLIIEGRILVLGWCHYPAEMKTRKRRKKIIKSVEKLPPRKYHRLLHPQNRSFHVKRFSPQVFTNNRLIQRTAADYDEFISFDGYKVLVAGLGSVGSHLVYYLASTGITKFWLIDNDKLSIENIGRHLLGIKDVGRNKAEGVRDYLQWKNPLTEVHVRENRVIPIILQEPEFISQCDHYFFCTGDVNTEAWVVNNLHRNEWNRPAFFIWVEPYLAGGHCVYIDGCEEPIWDLLFEEHKFIHNIISNKTHDEYSFMKREAGCQTTYLPYSGSSLNLFLAALFPKLLDTIRYGGKCRCFSWVGDLGFLAARGIETSEHIKANCSFSLIERHLC